MTSLFPVALSLLAAAASTGEVEIAADKLVSDPAQHLLTGHAVLRAEGAVLRADQIIYRRIEQIATARGNVTMALSSGGLFGAVAQTVTWKIEGDQVTEVFIEGGRIMQKAGVTPEQLFDAATPDQLEALGRTSLTLSGTHLARAGDGRWKVDDLALSPCDCGPGEPALRVEAPSATLNLRERRAAVLSPTVYVKSLPVFWLPWIDLPLSNRASGLLVPRPSWGKNGLGLDLPLFLTLGQSYDLTFTPGYFTGRPVSDGVTGPRLHTELRYAPTDSSSGRATVGLLYDLRPARDPVTRRPLPSAGARGPRAEGSLLHVQELGQGWFDRIDASVISDGFYRDDLAVDLLVREDKYLRSNATVFHRSDELFAGLEAGLLQDLRWGYRLFGGDQDASGALRRGPSTLQRLPVITAAVPERPLFGPLHGSFRAEYARHAPITSITGDEGVGADQGRPWADIAGLGRIALPTDCLAERLFWPLDPLAGCPDGVGAPDKSGQGDGLFQPGEREARDRLDLRPRLSASFRAGELARLTPYAAFREDLYFGEATGRLSHRGYPMAGILLDSELGRSFGQGQGALRHSIVPSVELRSVPVVFGAEPAPYDDLDLALPEGGRLLHAVAEVRQSLFQRQGLSAAPLLRLDLGQGVDLLQRGGDLVRDSYARLAFARGPLAAFAQARVDLPRERIGQLSAGASLDDGKGSLLYASYDQLFNEGSDRTRREIDALVGAPPLAFRPDFAQQLVAGFHLSLRPGLALDYRALVARTAFTVDPGSAGRVFVLSLRQQQLGLSYGPACDCWRVELQALHQPDDRLPAPYLVWPTIGATLTLSGFGTVASGG